MATWGVFRLFLLLFGLRTLEANELIENVSESAFGSHDAYLPLAFGDFNDDKLTDVFVVSAGDRSKLLVLLAKSGKRRHHFLHRRSSLFRVFVGVGAKSRLELLL